MQIRRIGVALAVYEPRLAYFVEQLASIQEQSFTDCVCVVTFDSPWAAVRAHPDMRRFVADGRFRWSENARRLGAAKNFERAIGLALDEGVDAIACCDYDDRWYPDKLATLAVALERAGPLSLVHSDLDLLRDGRIEGGTAWRAERRRADHAAPWQLLVRNVVTGCAMAFDAALARRYPEVPAEARLHDRWYALAASCHGGVHAVERPLLAYRVHGAQDTGVAPYRGFFASPPGVRGAVGFVRECVRVWRNAHALAREAVARGVPLPPDARELYLHRRDLGLRLALAGALQAPGDPVLARAALAAAFGKLTSTLTGDAVRPLAERTAVPPAT